MTSINTFVNIKIHTGGGVDVRVCVGGDEKLNINFAWPQRYKILSYIHIITKISEVLNFRGYV